MKNNNDLELTSSKSKCLMLFLFSRRVGDILERSLSEKAKG